MTDEPHGPLGRHTPPFTSPLGDCAADGASLILLIVITAAGAAGGAPAAAQASTPEARALAFLAREVPRWPDENACYSCHNNGDAARALYTAIRYGYRVPPQALSTTTAWLQRPDAWDDNALGEDFSDTVLARIQFSGALVAALAAEVADDHRALDHAATLVARDQQADGSWRLDSSGSIGSPATYGTALATWSALRTLKTSGSDQVVEAIARGDRWLRKLEVKTVIDAAAALRALDRDADAAAAAQRQRCLHVITDGQAPSGGWGAYLTSATEPFDTAVVLLALQDVLDVPRLAQPALSDAQVREMIATGRALGMSQ